MLALIATSPWIGWERGARNGSGSGSEVRTTAPPRQKNVIRVDSKESKRAAVQQFALMMGGARGAQFQISKKKEPAC